LPLASEGSHFVRVAVGREPIEQQDRDLAQTRTVLRPGGLLLYCDNYFEHGKTPGLLLYRAEQPEVLRAAGYSRVDLLLDEGGMTLYAAQ
jgi:hypothetical protein